MNKKLQVFVSSTYTDLIEERQVAVQAILDAGHIPAGMELFKAGKSQIKTIQKWIDESDVYMLILGGRYGTIEEESGLSYTELEYRYALSKNIPVFALVLEDSYLFTKASTSGKNAIFEIDNINKYETFKGYVKSNIVKFVKNINHITSIVHAQLNDLLNDNDYNLIGWVRNQNINIASNNINVSYPTLILKQTNNYTFDDLIKIFSNKKLPYKQILPGIIYKKSALNTFMFYYHDFCTGVNIYAHHLLLDLDNEFVYKRICPFFMSFKLIEYAKSEYPVKQKYIISPYGINFYLFLETNQYLNQ